MIQVFGCIEGTYIPIKMPLTDSQDYFNYKLFFSLTLIWVGILGVRFEVGESVK